MFSILAGLFPSKQQQSLSVLCRRGGFFCPLPSVCESFSIWGASASGSTLISACGGLDPILRPFKSNTALIVSSLFLRPPIALYHITLCETTCDLEMQLKDLRNTTFSDRHHMQTIFFFFAIYGRFWKLTFPLGIISISMYLCDFEVNSNTRKEFIGLISPPIFPKKCDALQKFYWKKTKKRTK